MFFGTGYEEVEALAAVDVMRRAGVSVDMVSITGEKRVTSSHQVTIEMDALLAEVDFEQVKMLVFPGGMPGTTNLEKCAPLMEQLDRFYEQKKGIAAICAAPSILGHRGMLKGKRACCYPGFESHLEGAEVTKNPCEVSENIITARGMGVAVDFGLAIVAYLRDEKTVEQIAEAIVYKA